MDSRHLEVFISVAATGSFSRSATLLATSQSSISKSIAALEALVRARLFDRTGRGATLTAHGRALLPRADALVAEIGRLTTLAGNEQSGPAGLVRLALQPSVSWPLVDELLARVQSGLPKVALQVFEGTTHQIEQWLSEDRVDLGLLSRRIPAQHAESRPIVRLPLMLIGAADDARIPNRAVSLARISRLPLILGTPPNGARLLLEELARHQRLKLNVVVEVNSGVLTKRLVARRHLYTVAVGSSVMQEVQLGVLKAWPMIRPKLTQTFYVSVGGRRKPSSAIRAVESMLVEHAETLS